MVVPMVSSFKQSTQLRWNRIHRFKVKYPLYIESKRYILKTADTAAELFESFKLRYQVFYNEFQNKPGQGIDIDKYDRIYDHLLIVDRLDNKIVGTYRLHLSYDISDSYSKNEFYLDSLKSSAGPFLELGRACIDKEHRNGYVIALLWRGIAEYMRLTGAQTVFGCSSVKIKWARDAALIYRHFFEESLVSVSCFVSPKPKYSANDFNYWYNYYCGDADGGLSLAQKEEAANLVPSLLKSYLKLGAKIAGVPAFDRDFNCFDFLTVLKKDDLAKSLARRFRIEA